MNGRIYDPLLGRFLAADPNIDDSDDSQGFNRYTYVHNNPLNETDPTGYLSLKEILPAIIAIVATVVVTVVTYGALTTQTAGFFATLGSAASSAAAFKTAGLIAIGAGGFAGGFASGLTGSLLNGGSIGDAFKAGVIGGAWGAVTALATAGIAHAINGANLGNVDDWFARVAAHGTAGGLISEAQGGEFRHGFLASAASVGFDHSSVGKALAESNDIAVRTATAAAIGGTASALDGGKFANGAVTSAFQHLFNDEASDMSGVTEYAEEQRAYQITQSLGGQLARAVQQVADFLGFSQKTSMTMPIAKLRNTRSSFGFTLSNSLSLDKGEIDFRPGIVGGKSFFIGFEDKMVFNELVDPIAKFDTKISVIPFSLSNSWTYGNYRQELTLRDWSYGAGLGFGGSGQFSAKITGQGFKYTYYNFHVMDRLPKVEPWMANW